LYVIFVYIYIYILIHCLIIFQLKDYPWQEQTTPVRTKGSKKEASEEQKPSVDRAISPTSSMDTADNISRNDGDTFDAISIPETLPDILRLHNKTQEPTEKVDKWLNTTDKVRDMRCAKAATEQKRWLIRNAQRNKAVVEKKNG
jgi:hypothetical protein